MPVACDFLGLIAGDPLLAAGWPVRAARRARRESPSRMKPPSRLASGQSSTSAASSCAADVGAQIELAFPAAQAVALLRAGELGFDRRQRGERAADERQIARAGAAGRHAGQQPLEVVDAAQLVCAGRRSAAASATSSATASSRALIAARSVSGLASQSASSREPIAVTVRSSTAKQRAFAAAVAQRAA